MRARNAKPLTGAIEFHGVQFPALLAARSANAPESRPGPAGSGELIRPAPALDTASRVRQLA